MGKVKQTISAVVLTKNEEEHIEGCLRSLGFVDEIILVDNNSSDNTLVKAMKYDVSVVSETGDDFSRLRNRGREKARGDWLLYLDADERITADLRREIIQVVRQFNQEKSPHAYFIKRSNFYLGQKWPYQDKAMRLFWKPSLIRWVGIVHESAVVAGPQATLGNPLIHHTHQTLEEMVVKTNEWSELEAKLRLEAEHPAVVWWRLLRVMFTGFFDSFIRQGSWKAGTRGWIESIYQAFSLFVTYAKLWEMQQSRETMKP